MASAGIHARLTDEQLVTATRSGRLEAFEALVERYQAPLLHYLTRQTGDAELAADLTQDTFLDAFRRLDRLADDRSFAAWLYRIAQNHLLMAWRRRRLHRLVSLDWLPGRAGAAPPALCRSDEDAPCHERDAIQQVLDELSPPLREALLLSGVGGFTSGEIAQILGVNAPAVRQRLGRAKEQFQARYRALNGGDDAASL